MKKCKNNNLASSLSLMAGCVLLTVVSFLNAAHAQLMDRSPANYAHNDDMVIVPERIEHWSENILVEDDSGVLTSMRLQIEEWQRAEDYVQTWDLDSTGLYPVASQEQKKSYVMRHLLRYADKRLSGEVKKSDSGSPLHSVGQVHQALRPSSEAQLSQNIKLKFKARALQGKAFMVVENPWVDAQTSVSVDGRVDVRVAKRFKQLGVQSEIRYQLDEGVWVAQVDKTLTNEVSARVTSEQNQKQMAFGDESNRTIQLIYHRPF